MDALMPRVATIPNFLILGAAGCGTRWLRHHLGQHPDIYIPPFPLDFFAEGVPPFEGPPFGDARRTVRGGGRWYRHQFMVPPDLPSVGELSPGYLAGINRGSQVAARIQQSIPDARLVALVRQPVERMVTVATELARRGHLPTEVDLFAMVQDEDPAVAELDLVTGSLYARNLASFHRRFGDQLLVVTHDDVRARPGAVYASVLDHIGADPDHVPDDLERDVFSDPGVAVVKPLTTEEAQVLYGRFRSDVEELAEMFDRDLSSWDPGPPPFSPDATSSSAP
jgi:hypothetical protein